MVHYLNITLIELAELFDGSDISILYYHHSSEDAIGCVRFSVVKKNNFNFFERTYIPYKLSGHSSHRYVSIESVTRELDNYYRRLYYIK